MCTPVEYTFPFAFICFVGRCSLVKTVFRFVSCRRHIAYFQHKTSSMLKISRHATFQVLMKSEVFRSVFMLIFSCSNLQCTVLNAANVICKLKLGI
jgi:hypothetical protein